MGLSQSIKGKIKKELKEEDAENIAIFGSFGRDEEGPESDIDVLVNFSEPKSLLDIARMERELSEKIGIKIDLVTEKSLSPYIRDTVENEKEVLT